MIDQTQREHCPFRTAGTPLRSVPAYGSVEPAAPTHRLTRIWTWILIGAGLWALGYYLPTYRLIHMVPILGSVRCPARMLLIIDFALVVLASVGIDALVRGWHGQVEDLAVDHDITGDITAKPRFARLDRATHNKRIDYRG